MVTEYKEHEDRELGWSVARPSIDATILADEGYNQVSYEKVPH